MNCLSYERSFITEIGEIKILNDFQNKKVKNNL